MWLMRGREGGELAWGDEGSWGWKCAGVGGGEKRSADCQSSGSVLFGGDMSGVVAACGLQTASRRATTPAEPGQLPGRNEALYWSPWIPSLLSATSCSTSESP